MISRTSRRRSVRISSAGSAPMRCSRCRDRTRTGANWAPVSRPAAAYRSAPRRSPPWRVRMSNIRRIAHRCVSPSNHYLPGLRKGDPATGRPFFVERTLRRRHDLSRHHLSAAPPIGHANAYIAGAAADAVFLVPHPMALVVAQPFGRIAHAKGRTAARTRPPAAHASDRWCN